jgi:hypothetical protein
MNNIVHQYGAINKGSPRTPWPMVRPSPSQQETDPSNPFKAKILLLLPCLPAHKAKRYVEEQTVGNKKRNHDRSIVPLMHLCHGKAIKDLGGSGLALGPGDPVVDPIEALVAHTGGGELVVQEHLQGVLEGG